MASEETALVFPEIILQNTLNTMLKFFREDAAKHPLHPENTFLYRLLVGVKAGDEQRFEFLKEAQRMFLSDVREPHALQVRLFFDPSRAKHPTIHFDLPGEEEGENGIGIDEDSDNALYSEEELEGQVVTSSTAVYTRRYLANYNIVCTGPSPIHTLIIYNVVRAWLIAGYEHLAHCGLENPHLSGNDLVYKDNQAPAGIFARAIRFRASYDLKIPALLSQIVISQLQQDVNN